MSAEQDFIVERHTATLLLSFNRPAARNALTFAMYQGLADAVKQANDDESIRVLVVFGEGGKAFAAGTDISQFKAFKNAQDAIVYEKSISQILGTLEACRVPTLAAVAGACTGGGFGIASCCDLRIATADAKFGFPMARTLGNCLSLETHARLVALLGAARVKDLVLTSRLMPVQELVHAGLITEVIESFDALKPRALALAAQIASQAPLTMRVTKESVRALQQSVDPRLEEELFLKAYLSQDFQEGVAAFLEKRTPQWQGK
jgi:enoyl-CoA hydratase